jgi:hypothetical protein
LFLAPSAGGKKGAKYSIQDSLEELARLANTADLRVRFIVFHMCIPMVCGSYDYHKHALCCVADAGLLGQHGKLQGLVGLFQCV